MATLLSSTRERARVHGSAQSSAHISADTYPQDVRLITPLIKPLVTLLITLLIIMVACDHPHEREITRAPLGVAMPDQPNERSREALQRRADSLQRSINEERSEAEQRASSLIMPTLHCNTRSLARCAAWRELLSAYASDLRAVVLNAPYTHIQAREWLLSGVELLKGESEDHHIIGSEILKIGISRLKFRVLPREDWIRRELLKLLERDLSSTYRGLLLTLLHELTPAGDQALFKRFTQPTLPESVQVKAWELLIKRSSAREPLSLAHIKRSMYEAKSPHVKAKLIEAAGLLKSTLVVKWCGKHWWEGPLFKECRDALTHLNHRFATRSLGRWVNALFNEADQALNSDVTLAEGLSRLSYGRFTSRLKRRYIDMLDRFFSRQRAERASLLIAKSWSNLKPKRFAMELCLRYLKPRKTHIVSQTQAFQELLRKLIRQLNQLK